MPSDIPKASLWSGRILSGLVGAFLILDGVMKLVQPAAVVEMSGALGIPRSAILPLGIVLLTCTALYLVPRTSVLGAVLLTGYLGGASAAHVLHFEGFFPIIFPVIVGAIAWGGLLLRDRRPRAVFPVMG